MLTIPLEKLAYVITKAREFDVEVPPVDEDSGSNPSDDAEWDVLEAGADNPTYQELVDAINSLSDPERIELLALTWLGRRRLQQGGMARGAQRSPSHPRRERDGLPDRHAAPGRLSGGRPLAAGLLDRRFRDRPHVTGALLLYQQTAAGHLPDDGKHNAVSLRRRDA